MADLWQVTLVSPPYQVLTYERPSFFPDLQAGQRVIVPLGRSHRMGIVMGPCSSAPEGISMKPLIWPLELAPLLDADYLEMAANLGARQMASVGRILEILLPRGLRTAAVTFRVDKHVSGRKLPGTVRPSELARFGTEDINALMTLWLDGRMRVRVNAQREAEERFVSLVSDPPWAVRPNAKRQIRILEYLFDNGPQSLFALKHSLGEWAPDIAAKMEGRGLVALGELTADNMDEIDGSRTCDLAESPVYDLTSEQQVAIQEMETSFSKGGGAHLVYGVTGSGKTVVYLEMVERCLKQGRSVILLAPEVALACKLYRNVTEHFPGQQVIFHHGYQSPRKREMTFTDLAAETAPVIVVGTRSALFLPLGNLGMVIMDEEHDESFKQEDRLAYHAKEVAWYRVEKSGGLLVLGSATPDIKTFQAAATGAIPVSTLKERVGDSVLPEVELVDIAELTNSKQAFAPRTIEALKETVKSGKQAIVMLNRRGYAPLMYCLDCGETVRCPECEVGMTYHKGRQRVVCHYCGMSYHYPMLCSKCGGGNFLPMGEGTERLEEYLSETLPEGTKVLRLDRDATRRQERMEEILDAFGRGDAQVLVGTQMISKGHHFPNVTLVTVVDGDLGLNLPDYRSSERTFQLLVQVAGRAGRGTTPGKVLIQTRNPRHPIWNEVLGGDYRGFFEREIGRRKMFKYPPFSRLALIRISYPSDYGDGQASLSLFTRIIKQQATNLGIMALGPAPAPLSMLRGRLRFNCLLKGDDWGKLRTLYGHVAQSNPNPGKIRTSLDLDPLTTL